MEDARLADDCDGRGKPKWPEPGDEQTWYVPACGVSPWKSAKLVPPQLGGIALEQIDALLGVGWRYERLRSGDVVCYREQPELPENGWARSLLRREIKANLLIIDRRHLPRQRGLMP